MTVASLNMLGMVMAPAFVDLPARDWLVVLFAVLATIALVVSIWSWR